MVLAKRFQKPVAVLLLLNDVGSRPRADLIPKQPLQQLDGQVALRQPLDVFEELLGEQTDVGLVEPGEIEDIDDAFGEDGVVQDLLQDRIFGLLRGLRLDGAVLDDYGADRGEKAISSRSAAASSRVLHSE